MRTLVVGAGVIGLTAAYELAKDGHEVTVLDAGMPGQGSTVGSAAKIALAETPPVAGPGMVVQGLKWMLNPDSPLYVRPSLAPNFVRFMFAMARRCNRSDFRRGLEIHLGLARTCLSILDEWRSEEIEFEEHRRGVILAYEHDESFRERRTHDDIFARFGYIPEVLDEQRVHEMEPALSPIIKHGLFYTQDGQLEPQSLVESLARRLTDLGHTLLPNSSVTDIESSAGRVSAVRTNNERYVCDALVLAAGAFCGPLTRRMGSPLPIRPGKGYSVDYRDVPTALKIPLTFEDAHVAVSPLNGGLRIAGTMEFAGFDTAIRQRRVRAMIDSAAAGFADWDPSKPHTPPWAGMRPMTPDGLPVIGAIPGYSNAIVASGHGMLGLTLAPSTAKAVAQLVRGDRPTELIASVSPARFR